MGCLHNIPPPKALGSLQKGGGGGKTVNYDKEIMFSGYNKAAAHRHSKWCDNMPKDLHKVKPDVIPAWRAERSNKSCSLAEELLAFYSYWEKKRFFFKEVNL